MKQSQKRKKKQVYTKQITAVILLGMAVLICLFNLALKDRKVSKPKMSVNDVLSGRYMEEYDNYFSESFAGKGVFESLDNSTQTLLGKRKSNGVYRGKEDYLLEEIAAVDDQELEKNVQAIKEFDNDYYNIPVYFMLVPNAANIQKDKLPASVVVRDQKEQFENIRKQFGEGIHWVDAEKKLSEHKDEEIYYRTDENWTSLGAHYGCEALADAMALDTSKAPKMKSYVVNNDFIGSLAKRSGYEKSSEESINVYVSEEKEKDVKVVLTNGDTGKKSATLFDTSKLEKSDKYSLFLGGDYGMLDIKTTADTTERLLIFKDSYANCLIPFLTPYYREIVVIDPSCYKGNVQEIMQNTKFTSILFLYNGNSFVKDNHIYKVLENEVK